MNNKYRILLVSETKIQEMKSAHAQSGYDPTNSQKSKYSGEDIKRKRAKRR